MRLLIVVGVVLVPAHHGTAAMGDRAVGDGRRITSVAGHWPAEAELNLLCAPARAECCAGELRDLKDLPVLRCAVGGQAQTIVTGDKDLLVLGEFQAVVITTPRIFLATLGL